MHSKQGLVSALWDQSMGGNRKGISCSRILVKMADANGIGRHHFQVKTDLRETGTKEMLDKMYNEEFGEVSFTESKKKKRNFATG